MTARPPNLGELSHQIREQLQTAPERLRGLRERLRENPAEILHTPIARIALIILLGVLLLLLARWFARGITPPAPAGLTDEATPWSVLYVACTNPKCLATGSIKRERDFNDWPVKCEKCGQESVYRAQPCDKCGQWSATTPGQAAACPHCARRVAKPPPKSEEPARAKTTDDAEDPW